MARANDIQYVQYYSAGNAARQLEFPVKPQSKSKPKTRAAASHIRQVSVDPLALCGTLVALVMLVCMIVGYAQVCTTNAQVQMAQVQVNQLEAENEYLQRKYDSSVDLEEVRRAAESMGLIPMEQAQHITITAPVIIEEEPTGWWNQFVVKLTALFA